MAGRLLPIASTGHITCNVISQRALERTISREVALMTEQACRDPAEVERQKELVPPWMKEAGDVEIPSPRPAPRTPLPPAPGNSRWVQHVMARREAYEAALGPKVDYPKPLIKLRSRTPTPSSAKYSSANSEENHEATDAEQRQLARLLHSLKDRLKREKDLVQSAEAKLARHSRRRTGTPLDVPASVLSKRFDELGANSKATSMARAKSCGWYPSQAAGFAPSDLAARQPAKPPKRTDRLLACPYAITDSAMN
ncbi:unnamed protein product [Symbiodinium natans]|uniref:Uncharacterized protein n=1 Tax=Symbiodinium natans TaxID=878477 RepID=A0A812LVF7_9DINO|nr:unnamed protein product [Symbiodinium natans]